ncbi:MAG: hypothetical protein PVG49_07785, partial [Desulfobacteraceae bacterium]
MTSPHKKGLCILSVFTLVLLFGTAAPARADSMGSEGWTEGTAPRAGQGIRVALLLESEPTVSISASPLTLWPGESSVL